MAKRGLIYYLVIGSGFLPLVYLYTWDRKNNNREVSYEDQLLKADKKKKLITVQEQRLMGERTIAKDVPLSDEEGGYM
jgi:hypothetical protein